MHRSYFNQFILFSFLISVLLGTNIQELSAQTPHEQANASSLPFIADEVIYDDKNGVVKANGNVYLNFDDQILTADHVIYNERNNSAIAKGNIRLIQPTGEILFADYIELKEDLSQGFVDNVKILLTDNARITSVDGDRSEGKITRLNKANYSPCDLCEVNPEKPPLWQVKSRRVVHDLDDHDIHHHHAFLEMKGIPIAYTPYFSHPDPTVKRRSGFLVPAFGGTSELGPYIRNYYYWDISPNQDLTAELMLNEKQNPVIGADYRRRFSAGQLNLKGSITKSDRFKGDVKNKIYLGERTRAHIFSDGNFNINDKWRWGFDYNHVTDQTYLKTYEISNEDILERRLYTERFSNRNYMRAIGYDFQDLRPETKNEPRILPWIYNQYFSQEKYLGGRFNLENEFYFITRAPGADTSRLSGQLSWQRRDIFSTGFVGNLEALGRGDLYLSDKRDATGKVLENNVTAFREFGQVDYTLSYPFIAERKFFNETYHHSLEPIVGYTFAPNVGKNDRIPNEDSRDFEFDYNNLFVSNRFSGYDLIEGGQRLNYGLKTGLYQHNGGETSFFLGQSYRMREDSTFPKNSGLEDHFSDFVGNLIFNPSSYYYLDYNFRFDNRTLKPNLQNLYTAFGPKYFRPEFNYLLIRQEDTEGIKDFRQELIYGFSSNFRKGWVFKPRVIRKLGSNSNTTSAHLALIFENECFKFTTQATKDYTKRSGLDPNSSIYFQIIFKTIGGFETPKFTR